MQMTGIIDFKEKAQAKPVAEVTKEMMENL